MQNFSPRNNKVNIDFVYKVICPKNRNNPEQNAIYKAYVFSFLLGGIYTHKTIHNYKSKETRSNICSLLNISERSYHRYLKTSMEEGFTYLDRSNPSVLRIKGMVSMVDDYNRTVEDKESKVRTYYKAKLRIPNLDFENAKLVMDTALLRYFEYKEELKRALSMKFHIHRSYKNQKKGNNFLLSYEDKNLYGSRTIARALSSFHDILNTITKGSSKSIEAIVYENITGKANDVSKINGISVNSLVSKEIYSEYLNKSLNSAIISVFNYFSLVNIDSVYLGDNGSQQRGESVGYTKSGFNSFLDRAEEAGLLNRSHKFAFFCSCDFDTYQKFKKQIFTYCAVSGLDEYKQVANRIVYKNGNILLQRENHIKVDTQVVKFSWDRLNYGGLINENPDIMVNDRYKRLTDRMGIQQKDGWFVTSKKIEISDSKPIICVTDGKVFSSYKKINIPDEFKTAKMMKELKKTGQVMIGENLYKFVDDHKQSDNLKLREYEKQRVDH